MSIQYNEQTKEFHLYNEEISYIMKLLKNGHLGQLYFGSRVPETRDYSYLLEMHHRPMTSYVDEGDLYFSLGHLKQEYPVYGTTDFRYPAVEILQSNGSRITDFQYVSHSIMKGKPMLNGLPATYTESDSEAETLEIVLRDHLIEVEIHLYYTIFSDLNAISRSVRICNTGSCEMDLTRAMSLCLDLPDSDYQWVQFSGAWSRERYVKTRHLEQGVQSINSNRGNSGHEHNPFLMLKRPNTDEYMGEVLGFSLVYSGNFEIQAEIDTFDVTRILMGINPFGFTWHLEPGEEFQTPEAVMVYSNQGMNHMSQTFHQLFKTRLARGTWRDKERPILLNSWEATYFDYDEDKLVEIAKSAGNAGIELFVLDDGWFGSRNNDKQGLGDWTPNMTKLKHGISGLSKRIKNECNILFGLWFEPEMVNKDSDLYRAHPDWIITAPGRKSSHGRNQFVLDFSRKEVVDHIYGQMEVLLSQADISYIKWDMNRCITECYSSAWPANRQGEVFHRYLLGVYDLLERLTSRFPHILLESCASGGGRFDPGMLFYAPQGWISDDSDAVERLKIQYGTSFCYPVSSMGAHVSAVPNHQLFRNVPLETRANVAYFGSFGYELALDKLTEKEQDEIREQIGFVKQYRGILHSGTFYRLLSPFQGNIVSWMVVSKDKKDAIVGYYKVLNDVNCPYRRLKLQGLNPDLNYEIKEQNLSQSGLELMNIGLVTTDASAGQVINGGETCTDFWSKIYILHAE
jgi:alpha-galactosidase